MRNLAVLGLVAMLSFALGVAGVASRPRLPVPAWADPL